jgi:hypothetical protein
MRTPVELRGKPAAECAAQQLVGRFAVPDVWQVQRSHRREHRLGQVGAEHRHFKIVLAHRFQHLLTVAELRRRKYLHFVRPVGVLRDQLGKAQRGRLLMVRRRLQVAELDDGLGLGHNHSRPDRGDDRGEPDQPSPPELCIHCLLPLVTHGPSRNRGSTSVSHGTEPTTISMPISISRYGK